MLKSTHRPRGPSGNDLPAPPPPPPLLPGWTEHKAPTGHSYYYNTVTKESTYTRPAPPSRPDVSHATPVQGDVGSSVPGPSGGPFGFSPSQFMQGARFATHQPSGYRGGRGRGDFRGGRDYHGSRRGHQPEDRPKSKHGLPGQSPWLLVKTKLGRRFVYHPDKGESFWKIPSELQEAVDEFERSESQQEQAPSRTTDPTKADSAQPSSAHQPAVAAIASPPPDGGSDEYEEVEETDEEDEEGLVKRPRVEGQEENGPQEFNEDDIAFQLQAMGQDYGLDPEEYGAGEDDDAYDEGAEGLPFTEEDATGLFKDLLDDHGISPYATWEKVVEEGTIIDDDRYTVLPTMKSRKEVWAQWSRERIQHAKELKAKQEKKDPRLPYLDFMQKHATPKLYWPEFKRKYRKEAEMRDVKLSDKEREKWYRGYISRLKLSESTRKSEFTSLLKSQPLSILNNATDSSNLPTSLRTDLRFLSIDSLARDGLVRTYISTLGPPPASNGTGLDGDEEDAATVNKRKEDRERRMKALAAREAMVAQEKRRQRGALEQGRSRLHEEEEELRRAMAVGKHGLKAQLAVEVEVHRAGDDEGGDGQGQTNDGEA